MSTDQSNRFKFNGVDLTDDLWVNPVRSLTPPVKAVSVEVPGRPGEIFVRTELQPLKIPVKVRLRCRLDDYEEVARARRVIGMALVTGVEAPLVLPDEPTRYYMAVLTDPGEMDNLWKTGGATLEFTAYDPIAHGRRRDRELAAGRNLIDNEGSWEAEPILRLTAAGGVVAVSHDESGRRIETASAPGAGAEIVIDMGEESCTADGEPVPITLGSRYFPLAAGHNHVEVSGAAGSASWEERWL